MFRRVKLNNWDKKQNYHGVTKKKIFIICKILSLMWN